MQVPRHEKVWDREETIFKALKQLIIIGHFIS
jgi:hypothetical protein